MSVRHILLTGAMAASLAASVFVRPVPAQPAPVLSFVQPLPPSAITLLQDRLRGGGDYAGRVDGIWGPDSQSALERFQARNGLQVTGQLNAATATLLRLQVGELLGTPPAAAVVVEPATLSPMAIRNLQGRLGSLGFYRGVVDGVWGPGTQTAVEAFQQGRGVQVTGQLNPATVQAMGLDPANLELPVR